MKKNRPTGLKYKKKIKLKERLINVNIRSYTHSTSKGVLMQCKNRDELKDFLMSIAYNKKGMRIAIY